MIDNGVDDRLSTLNGIRNRGDMLAHTQHRQCNVRRSLKMNPE